MLRIEGYAGHIATEHLRLTHIDLFGGFHGLFLPRLPGILHWSFHQYDAIDIDFALVTDGHEHAVMALRWNRSPATPFKPRPPLRHGLTENAIDHPLIVPPIR